MNKVTILGEVEAIPGLSRWTSAYPDQSYLAMALLSISSRDQHWVPNMVPFPGEIIQLSSNELFILDHSHHGKGSVLFLLE